MWMDSAIASSAAKHEATLLATLIAEPGNASKVIENLAGVLAGICDASELSTTIATLEKMAPGSRALHLLKLGLEETKPLAAKHRPRLERSQLARQNRQAPTSERRQLAQRRSKRYP